MSTLGEPIRTQEDHRPEFFRLGEKPVIVQVPMDSYVIAGQMRASQSKEKADELRHDIEAQGEMHTPIFLAQTPLEVAEAYVNYTNECWGKSVEIPESAVQPNGSVLILAAGHRRDRAYRDIAKDNGYSRHKTLINARIFPKYSVEDIIRLQVSENFHDRPPAIQYARAVKEMHFVGCQEGRYGSIADFLPDSPLGERATRDALRYFALPNFVQELVDEGRLPYSLAIDLTKLQRAAIDYFLVHNQEEIGAAGIDVYMGMLEVAALDADDKVKTAVMEIISHLRPKLDLKENEVKVQSKKGWSVKRSQRYISDLIQNLANPGQLDIYAQTHNAIERQAKMWEGSERKRQDIIGNAAHQGFLAAKVLIEQGSHLPLDDRDLARIKAVLARVNDMGLFDTVVRLGDPSFTSIEEVHPDQMTLG